MSVENQKATTKAGRKKGAKRIEENQKEPDLNPTAKGTMREPSQQAAPGGDGNELKEALQDLEETKGDWSKGG
jgi:hypothetical protein